MAAPATALRTRARGRLWDDGRLVSAYEAYDRAPRPRELADLRLWRAGNRLHRALQDGGYTMLSARRARNLLRLGRRAVSEDVPGALVDCGTWNGGSTALLSAAAPQRDTWAFDSFAGLPDPGDRDEPEARRFAGELVADEAKLRE